MICLYLFLFIGFAKSTVFLMKFVAFIYRHLLKRSLNFKTSYGDPQKESWAVVTGGSDGIGEELCNVLAK